MKTTHEEISDCTSVKWIFFDFTTSVKGEKCDGKLEGGEQLSPQEAQTTHDTTSCQLGRHQFEPRLKYLPFATDLEEWDENLHGFFW